MSSIVFNSLEYAKRLESVGFTREQAEAQANIMRELVDDKMSTKYDLRELELRLAIRLGGMLAALITFSK